MHDKQDMDNSRVVEVFSGNSWETAVVTSLLEDAGIDSFQQNAIRGSYDPFHILPGGAGSVKIMVMEKDYGKSRAIVEGYVKNQQGEK